MFGSEPGETFIMATFSWKAVSIVGFEFDLALNSFKISILFSVILAMGESFMIWKVEVCIFLVDLAGIARHVLSEVDSCPMSAISAMSDVANFAAQIRFSAASVLALSIDL